jgi:hypothetical protein
MSHPSTTLLLLAGLASPLESQSASTAAWTIASGEFVVHGHTVYTASLTLVPRIVYDTAHRLDSARVVDSVRSPAAAGATGLAAGLSAWPADAYCAGPATAAMQSLDPRALLGRIQLAARCGVRLIIVPPRRLTTTNGRAKGVFSVDSARRLMDRYAEALPADSIRKYRATILGMNLGDDYGCAACWGGTPITGEQIAEWAAYARVRLPGMPLGVRVTPDWVARSPGLAPLLDYAWAQYHTRKGEPAAYFDGAAAEARRLGLRLVMGVNVNDCYGVGTSPCTAADLARFGAAAVGHPESCAFINWRYDAATWARTDIRDAWTTLLASARGRPPRECRR